MYLCGNYITANQVPVYYSYNYYATGSTGCNTNSANAITSASWSVTTCTNFSSTSSVTTCTANGGINIYTYNQVGCAGNITNNSTSSLTLGCSTTTLNSCGYFLGKTIGASSTMIMNFSVLLACVLFYCLNNYL